LISAALVSAPAVRMLWDAARGDGGDRTGTPPPLLTIERVRTLSELMTLTVRTADVRLEILAGFTGSTHALLLVHGEVRLGVDLSAARFECVDPAARRAVLVLPQPTVRSARLDHGRTRLLRLWDEGLWAVTRGGGDADAAVVSRAYRDAERLLADAARDSSHAQRARAQAEHVLRAFLDVTGWRLDVRWDP
jgi:hypothetical protein